MMKDEQAASPSQSQGQEKKPRRLPVCVVGILIFQTPAPHKKIHILCHNNAV